MLNHQQQRYPRQHTCHITRYSFMLLHLLTAMSPFKPNNTNRGIFTLWWNIIDIIGPINKWPKAIRRLFWKKNWNHEERFKIVIFIYINGLNPTILYDWIQVYKNISNRNAWCHLRYLLQIFEEGIKYRKKYWAFNVTAGCYQYLDGTTRYYH